MAIRELRTEGDPVLRKTCKPVRVIDDRLLDLLRDMEETMRENNGVGLAAPQVGILKRVVVVDPCDGSEALYLINPVITSSEGDQECVEGCLSVPNKRGMVHRPYKVTCQYVDTDGNEMEIEAEELLANIICHELDHLDGVLYVDKAQMMSDKEYDEYLKKQEAADNE